MMGFEDVMALIACVVLATVISLLWDASADYEEDL